jgi:hypothetical protein
MNASVQAVCLWVAFLSLADGRNFITPPMVVGWLEFAGLLAVVAAIVLGVDLRQTQRRVMDAWRARQRELKRQDPSVP